MSNCLDENTILEFTLGRLSPDRLAMLEQHVDECASCIELVAAAANTVLHDSVDNARGSAAGPTRWLGPYKVLEPLGYGGSGIVYRAEHGQTGETVALKTVRVWSAGALASIRREIHALSRIRHPGIVRIHDQGVQEGRPWYAMELVEGQTLESCLLEQGWRSPEERARATPQLLDVLRRLCHALGFLHGQGLVHRDLSPRNVVLRTDGTPVLVDFGLALPLDGRSNRDLLDAGGLVVGTLAYIAPEQLRGEIVDARADLYSLGCILYEAVTGRRPFTDQGGDRLVRRHLHDAPDPPSQVQPGIHPQLESLILRLLRKQRRERIGYAEDVAAELGQILGMTADSEHPTAQPYVYRPSFAGRAEAVDAFEQLLDRCADRAGTRAFLLGESGVGKTRLLAEVTRRARLRGLRVITSECLEQAGALHPFRPLLQTIADLSRTHGRAFADRVLGERGRLLADFEPELQRLPGQEAYPEPAPLAAQAARHRLFAALRDTLAAVASDGPLMLVIDDLQWADELSLAFIENLPVEWLQSFGVLLVGSCRREELSPALERVIHAPEARLVQLGRLTEDTISAMVGDMLALSPPPHSLLTVLVRESEGNPFFVTEYLRTAVGEGWLRRDRGGAWRLVQPESRSPALHLPETLKHLIGRRLEALSPAAQALLEAAAVLGRESPGELIATTAGLDDDAAMEAVSELAARSVLEPLDSGTRLRFAHDKLREVTYGRTAELKRQRLHERAARTLEARARGTAELSLLYPTLAGHFVRAGAYDKAIEYLEKAGNRALETAAFSDAAVLLQRALDLESERRAAGYAGEREDRVARWQRRLGEAHFGLGDLQRCETHSLRALAALGAPLPTARVGWAGALVKQLAVQAGHLALRKRLREHSPLKSDGLHEAALAAARLAYSYYFADDALRLLTTNLLSVNLADRTVDDPRLARPYAQLGYLAGLTRVRRLSSRYFERARRIAAEAHDTSELAVALYTEAVYHVGEGRFTEGRAAGERALQLLGQNGNPQEIETVLTILAHVDCWQGDYAGSRAHCERLAALARARANLQHEAWGYYAGARSLLREGRLDEAVPQLSRARELLRGQSDRASEIICCGLWALAELERGHFAEAERLADETSTLVGAVPPVVFSVGDGFAALCQVYLGLRERCGDSPRLRRRSRAAFAALRRFALVFPIGRPAAYLCSARLAALEGKPRRRAQLYARAYEIASGLGMPFEAAAAQLGA
jgi:tetratricopeptide (TPR) repeat protein